MSVNPNTPAGTPVRITSSGKIGTTTGNQRWRSAGGMRRLAHEVKLTTGATSWATFLEVLEDQAPEAEGPACKCAAELLGHALHGEGCPLAEGAPLLPDNDGQIVVLPRTCVECGEHEGTQWWSARCRVS